jgi:hypothetical protein
LKEASQNILALGVMHPPYTIQTDDTAKVCFAATLGEEPEIELACVLIPIRTENVLRFSAVLHDVSPDVRFEKIV